MKLMKTRPKDATLSDKIKPTPAYQALAKTIRDRIASGEYPQGRRIPSESLISQESGLSNMTVRHAEALLVQEGLLKRIQGSGTYVVPQTWTQASFSLGHLAGLLEDQPNLSLTIFKASLVSAGPKTAAHLNLDPLSQVIYMDRMLRHKSQPILLSHSVLRFEPFAPVVEADLEQLAIFSLYNGGAKKTVKKSLFKLGPKSLNDEEAKRLGLTEGEPSLKITYTLYDHNDCPLGLGWFLAPRKLVQVTARLGVWEDPQSLANA
ncbi:MAG: GntR family transcriptional regulator [Deltaproteobacteria bacterium]|jgi:GntR family transcriptional regulator|nr:GntR family transcriptional regulator [Deltaproteobacteria bacterium]